ncbi:MAG: hypothetical protein M1830_003296 [Pleopsidium flavum]|nr:MAG: hypothetical protein M1830_003296 [Pleopsidium flavum]
MERVARRYDATSSHLQDRRTGTHYATSLGIDNDILSRIRSLLASRNDQHPPRTPLPTPDYSFHPRGFDENTSSYFHTGTVKFDLSNPKTVANLARNEFMKTSMVVKHFDEPAGQSEASSKNKATKLSVPAKNWSHQQIHVPRFFLRTLPPANPQLIEARLRPSIHHVPGSYRSELDHTLDGEIVTAPHSPLEDALFVNDKAKSVSQTSSGNAYESELLGKYQNGAMGPKHAPTRSMDSRSILSQRSSLRTTRSAASVGSHHHRLLLKPSADSMTCSSQIPNLLTSGFDHGYDHEEKQPLLQSFPAFAGPGDDGQLNQSLEEQAMTAPVVADGPKLSHLLSQLPPLKQGTVDGFKGHHLTAMLEVSTNEVSSTAKPSIEHGSEQSGPASDQGPLARQPQQSLMAETSNRVTGLTLSELDSRLPQIATRQSRVSGVPSIHSSPLLQLSPTPMSSNTTLQTKSSKRSSRHGTYDFNDEATRLIKPTSLPSMGDSVTTDHDASHANQRRLSHQSYRPRNSRESGQAMDSHGQPSDSQKHWVRQLLQRGTNKASSQDSSHLTARPFHRKRHATTQPGDRNLGNSVPLAQDGHPIGQSEGQDSQSSIAWESGKQKTAESFTKVILDLETLLNEALSVARHAADRENIENLPAVLEEASRMLKSESDIHASNNPDHSSLQGRSTTEALPHVVRDYYSDSSASSSHSEDSHWHVEDGIQLANQHNEHVIIVEPDDEALQSGHFRKVRNSTPYPVSPAAASRQVSMVPGDTASQAILLASRNGVQSMPIIQEQLPEQVNIEERTAQAPNPDSPEKPHSEDFAPVSSSRQRSINIPTPPRFYDQTDWAYSQEQRQRRKTLSVTQPLLPTRPTTVQTPSKEETRHVVRENRPPPNVPSSEDVQNYIVVHNQPPIQPRLSSAGLRSRAFPGNEATSMTSATDLKFSDHSDEEDPGDKLRSPGLDSLSAYQQSTQSRPARQSGPPHHDTITSLRSPQPERRESSLRQEMTARQQGFSLRDRHHFSLREPHGFSLSRSHRRAPIARDWGPSRKRFVAAVACISTALLGLIVGIYAGEVPAIQYSLADEHHYTILGNVFFYIGLAISTLLFWPLPLLHGRKPYTLVALALLLPLQFPQAIVVGTPRSPYVATYRVGLLFTRAISGLVMGFASVNFKTTLLDLFGASLQSGNPHEEIVNENDVRRHGGGMGVWLGIWTWCSIGSIGVGFLIGALIISRVTVGWGFYITVILIAFVLFLNVLTPEVRRSPYRRSVAEVRTGTDISRRVARGEVMMHLRSTGPVWWWEEVIAGQVLCIRMLKQPGFVVLSLYIGWIYGQIVMVIVLLGALISKYYRFHPQYVGLCVFAVPLGALLAIPFQKASLFSRSRHHAPRTDSMTFQKRVTWTSHLLRRAIFMIILPFADMAYTLASAGPPIHFMVPTFFAGVIGFLSNLAIAECNGIIMETYDTSDLQPGMTGKPRNDVPESVRRKRTNFSCYPRVTAGCAIAQAFAFLIAAAATGAGGAIERKLGAQTATGVVAIVLLILTILLIGVLWRFKEVQVVPTDRFGTGLSLSGEEPWRPVIIGNPSGRTRRMSLLELGKQSRWSEIRRKNKLTGLD